MRQEDFFCKIESQFKAKLPFTAYRKPNAIQVKGWLQTNKNVHYTSNFEDSGFVFSPFDSENPTILFPTELSTILVSEISMSTGSIRERKLDNSSLKAEHHKTLVQKGVDAIQKDQLEKVVLSRVEVMPISNENPVQIFETLLKRYTNAFVYIWYHPNVGLWLGATPETLLNVDGMRFKTMSLAGTQSYKNTLEVSWDSKNIDEQRIVTDFIEDTLKPIVGQLQISEPKTIRAGSLVHLQSQISGILRPNQLKEIIEALHPTPAVCGLPKIDAKCFIENNENYNREFYTGFLGELNIKTSISRNTNKRNVENNAYGRIKKTSELFVNLRCLQIKNQQAFIYVGGGITKDSIPAEEWKETVKKSEIMMSVLT